MKGRGDGGGCLQNYILNYISVLSYTDTDNSYSLWNNDKLFYSAKKISVSGTTLAGFSSLFLLNKSYITSMTLDKIA